MSTEFGDKKLLLIGPNAGSVHLKTYFHLIADSFEKVHVITEKDIDYASFNLVSFSIKNLFSALKTIKTIRGVINSFQPDIIHIHQANSCAFLTLRANRGNAPVVVTAWGSDVLVLPQRSWLTKKMVEYVLKRSDVVTADAQYMIDSIKKLNRNCNCVLANFGVHYEPGLQIEKQKIIYSNRLHFDLYNIDLVIKGFARFVKKHPGWKLIIGATGNNSNQLKELAKIMLKEEEFEFIGFVDQETNQSYYLKSHMWVSIPSSDGTSISLLECMAAGCVPVVSDLPANHEWIQDGVNGVIYEDDLLSSFEKALSLNQQEVRAKNQSIILKRGTKESNLNIYLNAYQQVLQN